MRCALPHGKHIDLPPGKRQDFSSEAAELTQSTREQFLATALRLFSERGFYGVSIANIAAELGLTKQALLHYFPSKEKLYGEVLRRISREFDDLRSAAQANSGDPAAQLTTLILSLTPKTADESVRTRLLMRELLDNQHRAESASAWYLKPLLIDLIAMAKAAPGWSRATDAEALALIYQLLGAVNYYAISTPTLRGIFKNDGLEALESAFPGQLRTLIDAALAHPPTRR